MTPMVQFRHKWSNKFLFFFFNDTATTEIYTLSLHDALPISRTQAAAFPARRPGTLGQHLAVRRSEEHTSELQSRQYLVCRLLLEKKKKKIADFQQITKVRGLTDHAPSYCRLNPL